MCAQIRLQIRGNSKRRKLFSLFLYIFWWVAIVEKSPLCLQKSIKHILHMTTTFEFYFFPPKNGFRSTNGKINIWIWIYFPTGCKQMLFFPRSFELKSSRFPTFYSILFFGLKEQKTTCVQWVEENGNPI